jgi:hypothetical protein
MSSSSDGCSSVNKKKLAYVFSLNELLWQEFDEDFKQGFIAKEKLHNFSQGVFKVVRPKLKIKVADDTYS